MLAPPGLLAAHVGGDAASLVKTLNNSYSAKTGVRFHSVLLSSSGFPSFDFRRRWSIVAFFCDELEVNALTFELAAENRDASGQPISAGKTRLGTTIGFPDILSISQSYSPWTTACNAAYYKLLDAATSYSLPARCGIPVPVMMLHLPSTRASDVDQFSTMSHARLVLGEAAYGMDACPEMDHGPIAPRPRSGHIEVHSEQYSRGLDPEVLIGAFVGTRSATKAKELGGRYLGSFYIHVELISKHLTLDRESPQGKQWSAIIMLCDDDRMQGTFLDVTADNVVLHGHNTTLIEGLPRRLKTNVPNDRLTFPYYRNGPRSARCNEAYYFALARVWRGEIKSPVMLLHNLGHWDSVEFRNVVHNVIFQSQNRKPLVATKPWSPMPDCVQGEVSFMTTVTDEADAFAIQAAGFPACIMNFGRGRVYRGGPSLLDPIEQHLRHWAPDNPDRLVAYVDGSDMIWMGCSESDLVARYRDIVQSSGKPIVFGAELYCSEPAIHCDDVPPVPSWAKSASGIPNLGSGYWGARSSCFQYGIDGCDNPPSLRHLNSGFFMGPALLVSRMLTWAMAQFYYILGTKGYGHQRVMNEYVLHNSYSTATLDYTASLVLNIDGLRADLIKKVVFRNENPMMGNKLCFIHAQGGAKRHLAKSIFPAMKATSLSHVERIAQWHAPQQHPDIK